MFRKNLIIFMTSMTLTSPYRSKKYWLFTLVMFLCAFAGTFEVGYASDFPYTPVTTELTISETVDTSVQRIFTYDDSSEAADEASLSFKYPRYSLHIYNQQVRSVFKRLSKPALSNPIRLVLPLKTIPQGSDEDFPSQAG